MRSSVVTRYLFLHAGSVMVPPSASTRQVTGHSIPKAVANRRDHNFPRGCGERRDHNFPKVVAKGGLRQRGLGYFVTRTPVAVMVPSSPAVPVMETVVPAAMSVSAVACSVTTCVVSEVFTVVTSPLDCVM